MNDIITIGLPSKGRLKEKSILFFNDNGLKIIQSEKERNYFGTIENKPNVKIIFLHAKEIIQRLGDGTLNIGVSGLDLLKESEKNLQSKINIRYLIFFIVYLTRKNFFYFSRQVNIIKIIIMILKFNK